LSLLRDRLRRRSVDLSGLSGNLGSTKVGRSLLSRDRDLLRGGLRGDRSLLGATGDLTLDRSGREPEVGLPGDRDLSLTRSLMGDLDLCLMSRRGDLDLPLRGGGDFSLRDFSPLEAGDRLFDLLLSRESRGGVLLWRRDSSSFGVRVASSSDTFEPSRSFRGRRKTAEETVDLLFPSSSLSLPVK